MAPKKRATKAQATKPDSGAGKSNENVDTKAKEADTEVKDEDPVPETKAELGNETFQNDSTANQGSKKRSKEAPPSDSPRKASRRSARGGEKSTPTQQQLLAYLLSTAALELTRPEDEVEDIQARGANIRTYSADALNPFEELLCAIILSRPISHRLGLRTIRTVLNEPYNFTSARKVQNAGEQKRLQAVHDARTQHKDKTAAQMGLLAEAVLDQFTSKDDHEGTQLEKLRKESGGDVGEAADLLRKGVKGLGQTGLEIFFRRVQWIWTAAFPNVDGRTADALRMLGLPQNGEQLLALIEELWGQLETDELAGEDDEARKRRALVVLLERATGAQLEHKIDAVLAAAAKV